MLYSIGKNLTAGQSNTLFTVPTGYHAQVTYIRIANTGGSTASISASWHYDGTEIVFQGTNSVGGGGVIEFQDNYGPFLVMRDGDYITATPQAGSSFSIVVTFDLIKHDASNFNLTT